MYFEQFILKGSKKMSSIRQIIKGGVYRRVKKYLPEKFRVEHFYKKKSGGRKINLKTQSDSVISLDGTSYITGMS